jgi:hypothetical protein
MSIAGGTWLYRIGVGINGNGASQVLNISRPQLEILDVSNGLVPSEYCYPGFSIAYKHRNPLQVSTIGKVTDSGVRSYFDVKPYSNILVVGDSRNDEPTNIAAQLNTLMTTAGTGVANIHAEGGWTTSNVLGPFTKKTLSLTLDKALSKTLLTRTFSGDGDYEMYNYLGYDFDTLYISDLGYNDINSDATSGDVTAYNNIVTMCNKADALGMKVILSDNNPFKAHATYTAGKLTLVKNLNRLLRDLATSRGYLFVSCYGKLGDSTDQDKLSDGAGSTPNYSQDALHLNDAGSTLVATTTKALIDANR